MQDSKKTKAQLISELNDVRGRLAALETKVVSLGEEVDQGDDGVSRRDKREELNTSIQFIGDFDLIEAKGVDLSTGGICFDADSDIPFEMEFHSDGSTQKYRAHLVWMKPLGNGRSRLGFRFVPEESSRLLWIYKELKETGD
jgi:hypothetical protein